MRIISPPVILKTVPLIRYKDIEHPRYKYKTTSEATYQTRVWGQFAEVKWKGKTLAVLNRSGRLTVFPDYAWDGPSGPTIDTKSWMDASLAHDVLYQMMREGKLPFRFRKKADKTMRDICLAAGMPRFRAGYSYIAVRLFAARFARPERK